MIFWFTYYSSALIYFWNFLNHLLAENIDTQYRAVDKNRKIRLVDIWHFMIPKLLFFVYFIWDWSLLESAIVIFFISNNTIAIFLLYISNYTTKCITFHVIVQKSNFFLITYISIISYECCHEYFFNTIFLCTKERFLITKVRRTKLFVL